MKPVSTGIGPFAPATVTVLEWPPMRSVAFVDGDLVLLTEQPRRRHAGNAGTDDRYVFLDCEIAVHCSPLLRFGRPRSWPALRTGAVTVRSEAWIMGEEGNLLAGVDPSARPGRIRGHASRERSHLAQFFQAVIRFRTGLEPSWRMSAAERPHATPREWIGAIAAPAGPGRFRVAVRILCAAGQGDADALGRGGRCGRRHRTGDAADGMAQGGVFRSGARQRLGVDFHDRAQSAHRSAARRKTGDALCAVGAGRARSAANSGPCTQCVGTRRAGACRAEGTLAGTSSCRYSFRFSKAAPTAISRHCSICHSVRSNRAFVSPWAGCAIC